MEIIKPYGKKRKVKLEFPEGEGRTKQSMKRECDINVIMAKYQRTGVIEHRNDLGGNYGDATGIELQEAMNLVIQAQETFNGLPSSIRKRFGNSPTEFMDFIHNPENEAEARKLGLLNPLPPAEPAAEPPTEPVQPPA